MPGRFRVAPAEQQSDRRRACCASERIRSSPAAADEPASRRSRGGGFAGSALTAVVDGYLGFLQRRPAFARLIQREQLDGGKRLLAVRRESRAMADAFSSLRKVARMRGLRSFDRDDAVLVCESLTYSPLTQSATFLTALGRNLDEPKTRRRHVALVVDQLLALIEGRSSGRGGES